jgi:hypothetical protein
MNCWAKIAELVGNGGNVVFLHTLTPYPCPTISQISPGSRMSKKFGISSPGTFSQIRANPRAWKTILIESL